MHHRTGRQTHTHDPPPRKAAELTTTHGAVNKYGFSEAISPGIRAGEGRLLPTKPGVKYGSSPGWNHTIITVTYRPVQFPGPPIAIECSTPTYPPDPLVLLPARSLAFRLD